MGGLSGAVSTKIVVQGALLLVSARIDRHPVQAVLAPSVAQSRISTDLVRRLRVADGAEDADRMVGGRHVLGLDRHEIVLHSVRVARGAGPAPLTIGSDLLRNSALALDFGRGRLHLMEHREVVHATRGMVRLPAAIAPSGCLEAAVTRDDGVAAVVALAPDTAGAADMVPVRVGGLRLRASLPAAQTCSAGSLALGWQAFGRGRMIVDLPDGALWIAPPA